MSTDPKSSGVKRRDFLKILGAGATATAAVGCGTDHVEKLIPYVVNPDETVPGSSNYYATTCRECASACGVFAEVRDGRAIKLEGNPLHPVNRGALCARGQAALQGLYNPDRFRGPMARRNGALQAITWEEATRLFAERLGQLRSVGQAANAVFINQHEQGSFPAFLDQWLAGYGIPAHLSYDADAPLAAITANRETYGVAWPALDFDAARLVVSFGADFLDTWGPSVPQQLAWADARAKIEGAPRMIYVGPRRSLTGLNADQWIACRPGSELAIANALRGNAGVSVEQAAQASGVPAATLQALAREASGTRPSMFLAGATGSNATELALAVNALNQAAGNVGVTVLSAQPVSAYEGVTPPARFRELAARMQSGGVPLLLVRGANPAFTLPKALGFAQAMARVPFKVSFSSYPDETTELCDLILPDHHALESWGDAEPVPGSLSMQQPTMDPVFLTRATADVLIATAKADPAQAARYPYPDYRSWLISRFPGGQAAFTAAAATGLARASLPGADRGAVPVPATRPATAPAPAPQGGIEATQGDYYLVIYPSPVLGSGAGANKPWLQELPDPVSKIAWQSWVEIHPKTAKRLGVEPGDHLRVETSAGSVTAPAYLYLGIREDTVAIALGRGHRSQGQLVNAERRAAGPLHLGGYGRYADGVGVNPLDVLPLAEDSRSGAFALTATKARVSRTGDHSPLVTTEGSARQHGRGVAQALTVDAAGRLRQSTGAEQADALAPGGSGNVQGGQTPGASAEAGAAGQAPGGAGGQGAVEREEATEGGHESFPSGIPLPFQPGLRSPVAADAQGDFAKADSKDKGMYDINHWSGMAKRRWAMTIDLARCTGCSACVTACYAENNLPTVGAPWQGRALGPTTPNAGPWDTRPGANILKGREMSWIRLERYYEGADNAENEFDPNFEVRFAPMLCQHCGNAPCEPVCPVYATYHSPDGLNVQVYNRCVGTRYCSNNCPYKVRYFNWFGYGEPNRRQYAFPEPLHWQLNPDVTVRGKGVMEKCTFCVQRIREAEHRATAEGRGVQADEFTTACAAACPSRAIVFGDAADASWSVNKGISDPRAYHVFEELNTYTAVVYLKKVNHPAGGAAPAATTTPAAAGARH
jgi:molybdopterin-containing oxidoreductase family iron-sulfur binding subunit